MHRAEPPVHVPRIPSHMEAHAGGAVIAYVLCRLDIHPTSHSKQCTRQHNVVRPTSYRLTR